MGTGDGFYFFVFVCLFSDQLLTGMRYQAKLLTLSPYCTIINATILLSILSFVGDFVTQFISLVVFSDVTSITRLYFFE